MFLGNLNEEARLEAPSSFEGKRNTTVPLSIQNFGYKVSGSVEFSQVIYFELNKKYFDFLKNF
jgi:hypothetical protein